MYRQTVTLASSGYLKEFRRKVSYRSVGLAVRYTYIRLILVINYCMTFFFVCVYMHICIFFSTYVGLCCLRGMIIYVLIFIYLYIYSVFISHVHLSVCVCFVPDSVYVWILILPLIVC